jgi:hypothetical protein
LSNDCDPKNNNNNKAKLRPALYVRTNAGKNLKNLKKKKVKRFNFLQIFSNFAALFGTPLASCYPGIKFRLLADLFDLPTNIELQVRVDLINPLVNSCEENYRAMGATIPKWVDPLASSGSKPGLAGLAGLAILVVAFWR